LKGSIVNAREVACARRLVFLRAESEGVNVDTFVRVSGVGLIRLDPREVRTFTLRETILAVKLELSGDDGVLTPAVHVKRGLRENEGSGIRDTRVLIGDVGESTIGGSKVWLVISIVRTIPVSSETSKLRIIKSTGIVEKTISIDVRTGITSKSSGTSESMDSVGESIDGIGVVEGLSTEDLEEDRVAD
jgi:hypothetical protein